MSVIVLGLEVMDNKEDGEGIKNMSDEVVLQELREASVSNGNHLKGCCVE